ncbi:MAG: zinc-binding alcohol dehydrogenase family protein [Anaerolineae bacterium]|nr:zinc-binding alcohol dehydrogenase family protein [Anaerolineae bacterium]
MKTIVLEEPFKFKLTDTPAPTEPPPGHALVRVHRVGVCGTDLHGYAGRQPFFSYPRILGHELGVEVMAVNLANDAPNPQGIQPGDRCSVEPYLTCGKCIACRHGKSNCCTSLQCLGVHTDGGMREYITLPLPKLHKSSLLTLEQLALVETLCIGAHAVHRSGVEGSQSDEFVLVIGAGPIGLSVLEFARLAVAPSKLIVMDINPQRLAFCQRQYGLQHLVQADQNPLQALQDITNGELPTLVFDATGNARSMMSAFEYVAHGGKLVYVGLVQGEISFSDPHLHRREITLMGSRNATAREFRRTIDLIERRQINTDAWITHRAQCDDMIAPFATWVKPETGVIKAMVTF